MIIQELLKRGFTETKYDEYDCKLRIHEIHYLFWSESMKHFALAVFNESGKKKARGVYETWNMIVIPKPIHTIKDALYLVEALTL